ncbi:MAG TPA: HD domain-containing protein, partial [Candidatus Desulfofervidus auxilii]|nr:HD domain-containing protein [Candidatus Desulfofervidus auxilii]
RAIRSVNQLIVKEKNRESLLKGACNNLIKTRGYHNAWIALLNESGKLETYAEAGIGKAFLPMIELLKKGRLTACSKKALKQEEAVITKDRLSACTECPLVQEHFGRGVMTIRLEYSKKVYGFMTVSIPAHLTDNQEEQSLFKEVAGDIAFAIHDIKLDEERKQAEENVKNAKDELQIILNSVPAIIFYKDIEGRIIQANKTLANLLKMPVKDIVGKTTEELFPKEQAEKMKKDSREVILSGKPKKDIIEPYDTPEGTRWAITDKLPYKDKKGKVIGIISLSKDITVQRKAVQKLKLTYQKLKKTMNATIDTMSKIIEVKDPYTAGHQKRVSQLATAIAKELNLSPDKIEGIRIASLIHDIGKISVPTEILSKSTTLSDLEFKLIKEHSQTGYDILKSIDFLYPIAQIVLQHHERLNGSGYPNKLKGDEILLEAKIIGVADVVEAMFSHRPYRPALGIDVAMEEITQNRGILYDPEVVDACLRLFKEKGFKFE